MHSAARDLTAAALIRDSAMRLFAERGFAAVTVRDIAALAGVSPPLVIHHFGSKAKLKSAVDAHAMELLRVLFAIDPAVSTQPETLTSMSDLLADLLEQHPTLMPYLRRLLVDGGPPADALFRSLLDGTRAAFEAMERAGVLKPSQDGAVRAAFLLVNDLGAMILRDQVRAALGVDPLGRGGLLRWGQIVMEVYGGTVYRTDGEQP